MRRAGARGALRAPPVMRNVNRLRPVSLNLQPSFPDVERPIKRSAMLISTFNRARF